VGRPWLQNTQTIFRWNRSIEPSVLRGLGPGSVLVLINGKEDITLSLINGTVAVCRGVWDRFKRHSCCLLFNVLKSLRDGCRLHNIVPDATPGYQHYLNKAVNELTFNGPQVPISQKTIDQKQVVWWRKPLIFSASYGIPLGRYGGFINFAGILTFRRV